MNNAPKRARDLDQWAKRVLVDQLSVLRKDGRPRRWLNRPCSPEAPTLEDGVTETNKKTSNKFSPEVRARAVRMVQEHRGDQASRWAAIAAKIGCSGETLRNWVRQAERDAGVRPGATTDEPAVAA